MTSPRTLKHICYEYFRRASHLLTNEPVPRDLVEGQLTHNRDMYREENPASVKHLAVILGLASPFTNHLLRMFILRPTDLIDRLILTIGMQRCVSIIEDQFPVSTPLPFIDEFRSLHPPFKRPDEEDDLDDDDGTLLEELALEYVHELGW